MARLLAFILVLSSAVFASAQDRGLVGEWNGEAKNLGGTITCELNIKEHTGDRASGTVYFGRCSSDACNRSLPVNIAVSGRAGAETLQVNFMSTGQMQLTRKGEQLEGSVQLTQASSVTLKRGK